MSEIVTTETHDHSHLCRIHEGWGCDCGLTGLAAMAFQGGDGTRHYKSPVKKGGSQVPKELTAHIPVFSGAAHSPWIRNIGRAPDESGALPVDAPNYMVGVDVAQKAISPADDEYIANSGVVIRFDTPSPGFLSMTEDESRAHFKRIAEALSKMVFRSLRVPAELMTPKEGNK